MSSIDDLTTTARIRLAALETFGTLGFDKATIRAIADKAGVSPALIIHHFGNKDGLRKACDDWAFAVLSDEQAFVASGGNLAAAQAYVAEHPELRPVVDYLNSSLREGGEPAARIFDRMCELTRDMLTSPTMAQHISLPDDVDATVALLVAYSMGVSMLGTHVARHLGGTQLLDTEVYTRYGTVATQLFSHPLFRPEFFQPNPAESSDIKE